MSLFLYCHHTLQTRLTLKAITSPSSSHLKLKTIILLTKTYTHFPLLKFFAIVFLKVFDDLISDDA